MLELSIANVLGKRMFGGAGGNPLDDYDWLLRCEAADEVYSSTGLAEFGDSVPTWGNIAEEPQECSDAVQTVEASQPIYLPAPEALALTTNQRILNYFTTTPTSGLSAVEPFELEVDFAKMQAITDGSTQAFIGNPGSSNFYWLGINDDSNGNSAAVEMRFGGATEGVTESKVACFIAKGERCTLRCAWDGVDTLTVWKNEVLQGSTTLSAPVDTWTGLVFLDNKTNIANAQFQGYLYSLKLTQGVYSLDIDVARDASIGDDSFVAGSGQTIDLVKNATNPIVVQGHSLIRHDGIDDFLEATLDASRSNLHAWFVLQHTTSNDNQRAFSIDSDNLSSPQFDEFAGAYRVGGNSNNWGDVLERNVLEVRWTNVGNACAFYIDGVEQYNTGAVSFSTLKLFLAGFTSGTFPHAAVDYEAIFVAKGILNNEESEEITDAIMKKYGIETPPPLVGTLRTTDDGYARTLDTGYVLTIALTLSLPLLQWLQM